MVAIQDVFQRGKIVDIIYGANIPLIKETIEKQLIFEEKNSKERAFYDFEEPLPFEIAEISRKQALKEARK